MPRQPEDLTGRRFGRLVARRYVPGKFGRSGEKAIAGKWLCDCDCGAQAVLVERSGLIRGLTKSCGCWRRERARRLFPLGWQCHGGEITGADIDDILGRE